MTSPTQQNIKGLSVQSQSVQQLYTMYLSSRFIVNRRYQRKLVWTEEEKQSLIDSILGGLPLPLILVAEVAMERPDTYELIDGLQRLNAIFAYLENEFAVNGEYFDLQTLADTKDRMDSGRLVQQNPILSREKSIRIANYSIALSVFHSANEINVEEAFRRINSGGRRLSRQELRQAGTVSLLADLVREIASTVRGDTSPRAQVPLELMPKLSITNRHLPYGVNVDEIFWVKQGILNRSQLRESRDEQLVLDILTDCLIDPIPTCSTDSRDEYYDYGRDSFGDGKEASKGRERAREIDNAIRTHGSDAVKESFLETYDDIRKVLDDVGQRFDVLIGADTNNPSYRHFVVVFMAMYELRHRDKLRPGDIAKVGRLLRNSSQAMLISSGGDWKGDVQRKSIDATKGVIRSAFEAIEGNGPAMVSHAHEFETLMSNALVEEPLFDAKQGVLRLYGNREVDDACIKKIARTLTAMANFGLKSTGSVVLGIADSADEAKKIENLDHCVVESYRDWKIVGINREANILGMSVNEYFDWVIKKVASVSGIDKSVANSLGKCSYVVPYRSTTAIVLQVESGTSAVLFGGKMPIRKGSSTGDVPREDEGEIHRRFFVQ